MTELIDQQKELSSHTILLKLEFYVPYSAVIQSLILLSHGFITIHETIFG